MTSRDDIPAEFNINGHRWKTHTYDGGNRFQWYRSFTDEEVNSKSGGRYEDLAALEKDSDFFVACPVFEDPSFLIELHHIPHETSEDYYSVTASETGIGNGITDPISNEFCVEPDDLASAIEAVQMFAKLLS